MARKRDEGRRDRERRGSGRSYFSSLARSLLLSFLSCFSFLAFLKIISLGLVLSFSFLFIFYFFKKKNLILYSQEKQFSYYKILVFRILNAENY